MSFGFSVGDFIQAGSLINTLIKCLSSSFLSSSSSYQELVLELQLLQAGLDRIEHLKGAISQRPQIEGIKLAALNCQSILCDFLLKIKKYDASLGHDKSSVGVLQAERSNASVIKANLQSSNNTKVILEKAKKIVRGVERKIEWEVRMIKEVEILRSYLIAHVGSLNLRLLTLGLEAAFEETSHNHAFQQAIGKRFDETKEDAKRVETKMSQQTAMIQRNSSTNDKIISLLTEDIASQLQNIVELAQKVSTSNLDIITYVAKYQNSTPAPELRYTWVQEPIKFEDALGRVIPVPSEYDLDTLESIIHSKFKSGPGHKKVQSGEYELFNTLNSNEIISSETCDQLFPGMSITMAIIVGRYGDSKRCPRPDCQSDEFVSASPSGLICRQCRVFFNKSKKLLPRPIRPSNLDQMLLKRADQPSNSFPRCKIVDSEKLWKQTVLDQSKFKNLRIYTSELPVTPALPPPLRLSHHYRVKAGIEQKRKIAGVQFREWESRERHAELNVGEVLGRPVSRNKTSRERTITSPTNPDEEVFAHQTPSRVTKNQPRGEESNRVTRNTSNFSWSRKSPFRTLSPVNEDKPLITFSQYQTPSIASAPSAIFSNVNIIPKLQGPSSVISEPPLHFDQDHHTILYERASATSVDLHEYMADKFSLLCNPLPLERSVAVQAQASGLLNAKCCELLSLQALVQRRLESAISRFSHGMEDITETRSNLKRVQTRISRFHTLMRHQFPNKYYRAKTRNLDYGLCVPDSAKPTTLFREPINHSRCQNPTCRLLSTSQGIINHHIALECWTCSDEVQ